MGGGKAANKTNDMLQQDRVQNQDEHSSRSANLDAQQNKADNQADQSRTQMQGTRDYFGGQNYSVSPDFSASKGAFGAFSKDGGIDAEKMRVAHPMFEDQMNNTGIGDNYRANGTYAEFAKTGGISDADKTNMRGRISAQVPSFYNTMNSQADRLNGMQGGYNIGAQAQRLRSARDQSAASADAVREGELGISDAVNRGRQWGATGMTSAEDAYQGERFRAGSALDASEANIQNSAQRGKMFGAQGLNDIDNATLSANQLNAGRRMTQDQGMLATDAGNYEGDRNYLAGINDDQQGERGLNIQAQQGEDSLRIANNPRTKIDWGKVAAGAGTAAMYAAMA